jgi:hypothetical protein
VPRPGWSYDGAQGRVLVDADVSETRTAAAALLARGGHLNAPAHELLPNYGLPIMGGFAYSVPLHKTHITMRGVPDLDCLHYCSYGVPEVWGREGKG